jgi:hypothetical protein
MVEGVLDGFLAISSKPSKSSCSNDMKADHFNATGAVLALGFIDC